jgi:hypothetical protein
MLVMRALVLFLGAASLLAAGGCGGHAPRDAQEDCARIADRFCARAAECVGDSVDVDECAGDVRAENNCDAAVELRGDVELCIASMGTIDCERFAVPTPFITICDVQIVTQRTAL